jgi:hypothetical protein
MAYRLRTVSGSSGRPYQSGARLQSTLDELLNLSPIPIGLGAIPVRNNDGADRAADAASFEPSIRIQGYAPQSGYPERSSTREAGDGAK